MWPKGVSEDWPISIKETIPIVFSGLTWSRLWQEKLVLVLCDNLAVVQVIDLGYFKDPRLMHHLRCLFLIAAHFELILKAAHILGKQPMQFPEVTCIHRFQKLTFYHQVFPKLWCP